MTLEECRNLRPKSAALLKTAGIYSAEDLWRIGAAAAYARVKQSGKRISLNLLWALEGALSDRAWQD